MFHEAPAGGRLAARQKSQIAQNRPKSHVSTSENGVVKTSVGFEPSHHYYCWWRDLDFYHLRTLTRKHNKACNTFKYKRKSFSRRINRSIVSSIISSTLSLRCTWMIYMHTCVHTFTAHVVSAKRECVCEERQLYFIHFGKGRMYRVCVCVCIIVCIVLYLQYIKHSTAGTNAEQRYSVSVSFTRSHHFYSCIWTQYTIGSLVCVCYYTRSSARGIYRRSD